ncbi:hypothetical protein NLI89_18265 [Sphingomonas faeni]|nr:hypothetical protein [Sphingomonas faeni]MCP8892642.1 hypothetical protein [Sphingomonas faeni]
MNIWRPEFEAALELFASVSAAVVRWGFVAPVLVGGAAVELYSGSAIATGDFDLVTARQDVVEQALRDHGFVKPRGPGRLTRGWIHPDLKLGFEVVGSALLDGRAEQGRVRLIDVSAGDRFAVISVEDLIADRMGQYGSGAAPDMLAQAQTLFRLYQGQDDSYLDRRIREETSNDYGIDDIL